MNNKKLIIKDFGPIKKVDIDLSKYVVFIGPQASGKSTIAKAVYFFRSLRDDLLRHFMDSINTNDFEKSLGEYGKRIRKKFLDFWGSTYHLNSFQLSYYISSDKSIVLNLEKKYVNPVFSTEFEKIFYKILNKTKTISKNFHAKNLAYMSSSDLMAFESEKQKYLKSIENQINDLFEDDKELFFIPAGRSLLATLSDQLAGIQFHKLDWLMLSFVNRIDRLKPYFNKSFEELVLDKKKLTSQKINFENVQLTKKKIANILKGNYAYDKEGEKIYYDKDNYVKLNYSSSGQQESIWILLLIFNIVLENKKIFIVFEEPEAHLYPEAQKEIIELITLLNNIDENEIIITTHTPYILSSLNNLLYAAISSKKESEVKNIIEPHYWIFPENFQAFFIENGEIRNIIDEETELIRTEEIDGVSEIIDEEYSKMFDLER